MGFNVRNVFWLFSGFGNRGATKSTRAMVNPMAQSQDRGLLFSVPTRDVSSSGNEQLAAASSMPPVSTGPLTSDSNPELSMADATFAEGKVKTPTSGLKKIWRSMTGRTPKSGQKSGMEVDGDSQDVSVVSMPSLDDVCVDQVEQHTSMNSGEESIWTNSCTQSACDSGAPVAGVAPIAAEDSFQDVHCASVEGVHIGFACPSISEDSNDVLPELWSSQSQGMQPCETGHTAAGTSDTSAGEQLHLQGDESSPKSIVVAELSCTATGHAEDIAAVDAALVAHTPCADHANAAVSTNVGVADASPQPVGEPDMNEEMETGTAASPVKDTTCTPAATSGDWGAVQDAGKGAEAMVVDMVGESAEDISAPAFVSLHASNLSAAPVVEETAAEKPSISKIPGAIQMATEKVPSAVTTPSDPDTDVADMAMDDAAEQAPEQATIAEFNVSAAAMEVDMEEAVPLCLDPAATRALTASDTCTGSPTPTAMAPSNAAAAQSEIILQGAQAASLSTACELDLMSASYPAAEAMSGTPCEVQDVGDTPAEEMQSEADNPSSPAGLVGSSPAMSWRQEEDEDMVDAQLPAKLALDTVGATMTASVEGQSAAACSTSFPMEEAVSGKECQRQGPISTESAVPPPHDVARLTASATTADMAVEGACPEESPMEATCLVHATAESQSLYTGAEAAGEKRAAYSARVSISTMAAK